MLVALFACGLGACTTSEAKDEPVGGTGGGAAGATGAAGTTGTAGTTGAAGSTGNVGVACLPPGGALITDFTYAPTDPDAGAPVTKEVRFGTFGTNLSGGQYIYPDTGSWPLVSDVTQSNWHISGTVGTYSGFGIYIDQVNGCNMMDASAYKGISFKIGGTVGQGGTVTLEVDVLNNAIPPEWKIAHNEAGVDTKSIGVCLPPDSAANEWSQTKCVQPTKTITVPATPAQMNVLWTDLTGGKPEANPGVSPNQIIAIRWMLPNPPGADSTTPTTYKVDITIDDLSFIP
jgi:hypothetical protein